PSPRPSCPCPHSPSVSHLSHLPLPSLVFLSLPSSPPPHDLHSFPTRRSSDLIFDQAGRLLAAARHPIRTWHEAGDVVGRLLDDIDRKSTRLNSSHVSISYAVFCLKKKKIKRRERVLEEDEKGAQAQHEGASLG